MRRGVRSRRRSGRALLLGVAACAWPRAAAACATCLSATDGTREAYYGTTLLLLLLPFLLVGAGLVWLRRVARRAEREAPPPGRTGPGAGRAPRRAGRRVGILERGRVWPRA